MTEDHREWVEEVRSREEIFSPTWLDPEPNMYDDPRAEAIWQAIKSWDINVPSAYEGYCGATGNHVKAIMDALRAVDTEGEPK
ncbi:MAG TPA: hypothetical protein VNH83_08710 [Bryobacteraceae bacterium]|nr:hypothetical protein [Bryobacteraceae bacterium]